MKKTIFYGAFMTALFVLGSCSSETDMPQLQEDDNTAKITLSVPSEVLSRSLGDGTLVNQVTYGCYVNNKYISSGTKDVVFTKGVGNMEIELVKGVAYDIVFWADTKGNNRYEFNPSTQTITMKDAAFVSNADEIDAFYGKLSTPVINNAYSGSVELRRPFAQINLGTNDLDSEMFKNTFSLSDNSVYARLTVDTYTQFNIFTGKHVGERVTKEYPMPAAPIDTKANSFPYMSNTYKYVAMNYILVMTPAEDATVQTDIVDLKYDFYAAKDATTPFYSINVNNVPVRQNYRTNIYGQIFTDNGSMNMTIADGFNNDFIHPSDAQFINTREELIDALSNGETGSKFVINVDRTVTLGQDDIIDANNDIEIIVNGKLLFTENAQIIPYESTLTLSGAGIIEADETSTQFILSAQDGNIVVKDGLNINLKGTHGLAFTTNDHTVTMADADITCNLQPVGTSNPKTINPTFAMADGEITLKNVVVRSNARICSYLTNYPNGVTDEELMKFTATDCKFINKAEGEEFHFLTYAFETYPGKNIRYEFINSPVASNTGCVHVYSGGTLICHNSKISEIGRMSNFKNDYGKSKTAVLVEAGAKGLSFYGYSGVYNEWNEDDATITTVELRGTTTGGCYMRESYYTGPTLDTVSNNPIAPDNNYSWGESTSSYKHGNILDLDGNIVNKSSDFKYRYYKNK